MTKKRSILGINGSASKNSSNLAILKIIAEMGKNDFELILFDDLTELPHFKTELSTENTPRKIIDFRKLIENADGIIICTPEYVFSIPSGLKNAIEWCVSTTIFSDKPTGLITASANGEKAHLELKLIMETLQTNFTNDTAILIQGVKGKVHREGEIIDIDTEMALNNFLQSFNNLLDKPAGDHA